MTDAQARVERLRHLGFTGSRHGMTEGQKATVASLVRNFAYLHHGDCIGADSDAHDIGMSDGALLCVHPPNDPRLRAYRPADLLYDEKPYHDRNRDIVNACDLLVATPAETSEQPSGGTWYTVRYAREVGKETVIVWPDGTTAVEGTDAEVSELAEDVVDGSA